MPHTRMLRPRVAVGIWGALCLLAAFHGTWRGDGARFFALALAAFAVLLAGAVWLASPAIRDALLRVREPKAAVLVALWPLGAFLLYALGAGNLAPKHVAIAVAYALFPVLLEASAP